MLLEEMHFIKGLDPVADALSGTVRSDVVSMKGCDKTYFIVHKGVGTTGTSTITVNACDNFTPSNRSAIPFRYRAITTGDTEGAVTQATSAGFDLTAGSSQLYVIEVDARDLPAGYPNVELTATEVVNDPVLAGIMVMQTELKYASKINSTAIA